MASLPLPRNASGALRSATRWVAELGPWFGLGRMVCKVIAILAKHGESFFAEGESFCNEQKAAPSPSGAGETEEAAA